jgi:hypothetical protein
MLCTNILNLHASFNLKQIMTVKYLSPNRYNTRARTRHTYIYYIYIYIYIYIYCIHYEVYTIVDVYEALNNK